MKGYSVGSVLERDSYAKSTYEKRETSNRSIMELDVYNRTDNDKHNLCEKLVKEQKAYVKRYAEQRGITVKQALEHNIVKNVIDWMKLRDKENSNET